MGIEQFKVYKLGFYVCIFIFYTASKREQQSNLKIHLLRLSVVNTIVYKVSVCVLSILFNFNNYFILRVCSGHTNDV